MGTKRSTSRKPPFVVTVVTLVGGQAFGCSSDAGGANDPTPAACPAPDAGVDVALGSPCSRSGMNCDYPIACHSGPVSLGLVCEAGVWSLRETACPHLADECTPRFRCGPAGWEPPPTLGMNPPAPCPETAPADGAACQSGRRVRARSDELWLPVRGREWLDARVVCAGSNDLEARGV